MPPGNWKKKLALDSVKEITFDHAVTHHFDRKAVGKKWSKRERVSA